jgi:hypothetical protein
MLALAVPDIDEAARELGEMGIARRRSATGYS